jgi:hypothetical protein
MLEIEIPDRPLIEAKPIKKTELQKEAEKVAREWARLRKKRPTKEQIERASFHPKIVGEAERRIAARTR